MKTAYLIFKILMVLPDLLKMVEGFFPDKGNGKKKLAMARGFLEDAFGDIEDVWPKIEKMVSRIVSIFNDSGEFKK